MRRSSARRVTRFTSTFRYAQNALLYGHLGAEAYLAWLRGLGVRYVVLANAPPDYSAEAESRLPALAAR